MNEEHLQFLSDAIYEPQGAVGFNALNWAHHVIPDNFLYLVDPDLNQVFNREQLFQYCANPNNSNLNTILAILAWGNMRRDHARVLFLNFWNNLEPIITDLRMGVYYNRMDAFCAFCYARHSGLLPYIGTSYFTKLICFLAPGLHGYIMDQWTGKSINLLYENYDVLFSNNWVNNNNNAQGYELFCQRIEELAELLDVEPLIAEERLFSRGRGQGIWRNYVREHYQ